MFKDRWTVVVAFIVIVYLAYLAVEVAKHVQAWPFS